MNNLYYQKRVMIAFVLLFSLSLFVSPINVIFAADNIEYLTITTAEARNISDRSVAVYWQASTGSQGEYRYATSLTDLANVAWTDSAVVNGVDSGHLYGSIVSFGTLSANTTYYVELRKWVGTGTGGKIYGPAKTISFATLDNQDQQLLAITNIETKNVTQSSATIYWQASTGSQGEFRYNANQYMLSNESWNEAGVINGSDTGNMYGSQVTLNVLSPGTRYYVEIRKYYMSGTTKVYGQSNILSFDTIANTDQALLDVSVVRTNNVTQTGATIYWQAQTGSQGQYRFRATPNITSAQDWNETGVINGPDTGNMYGSQVTLSNLAPGTTYYVEVRKYVVDGSTRTYGQPSVLSFDTLATSDLTLLNIYTVQTKNITPNSATIYWQALTGSQGQYRYSTTQNGVSAQNWTDIGVVNGLDTGNMYGSQVTLNNLNPGVTYYVEVRKSVASGSATIYGQPNLVWFFTAAASQDLTSYGVTKKTISGNLVKIDGNAAVYLVEDGKRYSFPNQKTYASWYGNNFYSVVSIAPATLASYRLTANITFKPGSLVKLPTVPKVYLVTDNGGLRWVTSAEKLKALGLSLSQVKDLPESFFSNYTVGADI